MCVSWFDLEPIKGSEGLINKGGHMSKRSIFLILSLTIFTLIAGCNRDFSSKKPPRSSFDRRHPGGHGDIARFGFGRIEKMAEELNLSEQQIEELKGIEKEMCEKRSLMQQEKKDHENIRMQIVDLIRKDSLSREEVLNFMNDLHSLKEEERMHMDSLIAERLAKIHSVLTKEQREILAKKLEEFEPERKFKSGKDIK